MVTRIGVLYPRSGEFGWIGALCGRAVEAALECARGRVGGLDGVELCHGDAVDPDVVRREASRLIDEGARIVIGTMYSRVSLAMAEVARERGVFQLETNAAADELTRRGDPHLVRFNTTASGYGRAAAALVARLAGRRDGPPRVGVAHLEDPFCDAFARAAGEGLTVVASERFPRDPARMRDAVRSLGRARPDVVVLAAFEDAVAPLLEAARDLPGRPVIVGNGAWTLRPSVGGRPVDLDGVYAVDTPSPREQGESALGPAGRTQLAEWSARHGVAPGEHLPVDTDLSFAAASVFFEHVLARAASTAADDLRAAAAAVDVPRGGTLVGYGVRFDERGDNERTYSVVVRWDGDTKRIVHPPELATAALERAG